MGVIGRIRRGRKSPDLDSVEGIEAIEIPKYKPNKGIQSPVNNIEYILQRKATDHKKNGRMDLAIACLRKSNEIFPYSNFAWSNKDYLRLVEFLKQAGQFDEARVEERKINDLFQTGNGIISEFEVILLNCKSLGTDLVESTDTNFCVCGECAKYTRRIFSISGKDKRFPVIPSYLGSDLPEHNYCINDFYPFVYGISKPTWMYRGKLLEWCNRPFKDERTREQRTYFKKQVYSGEQEQIDRKNYDFLREHLASIAPKSFAGYRRMKNLHSSTYIKICNLAAQKGINLDESPNLSSFKF